MKRIFIILLFSVFELTAIAQSDYTGIWQGYLVQDNRAMLMVLRISKNESKLKGTMDIPQQMLLEYKNLKIHIENDSLQVDLAAFKASYKAVRDGDSLRGIWFQSGQEIPIVLGLTSEEKAFKVFRPQTPQPPFPYITKDVTFENKKAKIKLAGTLTIPDTSGLWPVVVLVSGSGPQDRDEELLRHRPFLVMADYFTRNGIAVLRYDDRGVAKSGGNFAAATTTDLSSDAGSAVSFLKTLPYIDKKAIGMVGHSEGGIIVLMQASQNKSLRFVISMAGVSVPCAQLMVMQNDKIFEGYDVSEDMREFFWNFNTGIYNLILSTKDDEELRTAAKQLLDESTATLSEEQKTEYGLNENYVNGLLMQLTTPWFRQFLSLVPANYIRKIKINVLAINGSKDVQVPADANMEGFKNYLVQRTGVMMDTHVFQGLNHLFQPCTTGLPDEYAMIETTIDPYVLQYMTEWIKKVLAEKK